MPRWNYDQALQAQLADGTLCKGRMPQVWRIKSPTENTDSQRSAFTRQTHSRAVRKWRVNASSGDPASGTCW
ncbi:hypothetical protein MCEZEM1_01200 [Comamonadaceae bacterium]